MANITVTTSDKQIAEAWTPELNRAVEWKLVLAKLIDDKSSWLTDGKKVHLPTRGHIGVAAKVAGTSITATALTELETTFTMTPGAVAASAGATPATAGHYAAAFELEDIAKIQSRYDLRAEYTESVSYGLARQVDLDIGLLFKNISGTNTSVGSVGQELADDDLILARNRLATQAAPAPWCIAITPAAYGGLLKTDKFVNQLYVGDAAPSAVQKAKVGMLYGAEVYESPVLTIVSGVAAPNAYGCMFSKAHFFKIVQRPPTTHALYQPLDVGWQISMDMVVASFERQEVNEATGAPTLATLWAQQLATIQ